MHPLLACAHQILCLGYILWAQGSLIEDNRALQVAVMKFNVCDHYYIFFPQKTRVGRLCGLSEPVLSCCSS